MKAAPAIAAVEQSPKVAELQPPPAAAIAPAQPSQPSQRPQQQQQSQQPLVWFTFDSSGQPQQTTFASLQEASNAVPPALIQLVLGQWSPEFRNLVQASQASGTSLALPDRYKHFQVAIAQPTGALRFESFSSLAKLEKAMPEVGAHVSQWLSKFQVQQGMYIQPSSMPNVMVRALPSPGPLRRASAPLSQQPQAPAPQPQPQRPAQPQPQPPAQSQPVPQRPAQPQSQPPPRSRADAADNKIGVPVDEGPQAIVEDEPSSEAPQGRSSFRSQESLGEEARLNRGERYANQAARSRRAELINKRRRDKVGGVAESLLALGFSPDESKSMALTLLPEEHVPKSMEIDWEDTKSSAPPQLSTDAARLAANLQIAGYSKSNADRVAQVVQQQAQRVATAPQENRPQAQADAKAAVDESVNTFTRDQPVTPDNVLNWARRKAASIFARINPTQEDAAWIIKRSPGAHLEDVVDAFVRDIRNRDNLRKATEKRKQEQLRAQAHG